MQSWHISRNFIILLCVIFCFTGAAWFGDSVTAHAAAPGLQNAPANSPPEILPLSQVYPGMKGVAYTIYSGDKVEQFGITVIGILSNVVAPRQSIILVKLEGPLAEASGVVAGMSGSPVYIDGKLVGAVALKLGVFTREAIAGVQPIEQMLPIEEQQRALNTKSGSRSGGNNTIAASEATESASEIRIGAGLPPGASLTPIDLPLAAAGLTAEAQARFSPQLAEFGFAAVSAGGTAKPLPDDAELHPGDMAGVALVSGDLSLSAGCTVTAVTGKSVLLCGHQLLGAGDVSLPLVRAHVLTTLNSAMESTKILEMGGPIGTLHEDRTSGIAGELGAAPATIPVSLEVNGNGEKHTYHFQVAEQAKITPVLVGLATYNALVSDPAYNDGMTLRLEGSIELAGHPAVDLHNSFAPTDLPAPDGFLLASDIQTEFNQIFNNPFEKASVSGLSLRINVVPELRSARIESAWAEKAEARPGETLAIKALLRPYRGAPFIREIPITIPEETPAGSFRVLVSDAAALNQPRQFFASGMQSPVESLDDLIHVLNKDHANDRLYVSLLQPVPTLMVDGRELPAAPPSVMQIIPAQKEGNVVLVSETRLGEWSVDAGQVVTGQQSLRITIR